MKRATFSALDLTLLLFNVLAFAALLVLMALRGPSVSMILLTMGALGMAIAKIAEAFLGSKDGA